MEADLGRDPGPRQFGAETDVGVPERLFALPRAARQPFPGREGQAAGFRDKWRVGGRVAPGGTAAQHVGRLVDDPQRAELPLQRPADGAQDARRGFVLGRRVGEDDADGVLDLAPALRQPALGDIDEAHHGAADAGADAHGRGRELDGQRRAVAAPVEVRLAADLGARLTHRHDRTLGDRIGRAVGPAVVDGGMHRPSDELVGLPAEHRRCRPVGEGAASLEIDAEDALGGRIQQGDAFLLPPLGGGRASLGLLKRLLQLDLGHHRGGQFANDGQFVGGPLVRLGVDGAERADGVAVGGGERHAGVGHDAEVGDGRVAGKRGVRAGIANDKGRGRGDDVAAERVGQRRLACRRPRLRQPDVTLEELARAVHQRHERYRHAQDAACQPGQAVEGRVRRRIEQGRAVERLQPLALLRRDVGRGGETVVTHRRKPLRPRRASGAHLRSAASWSAGATWSGNWRRPGAIPPAVRRSRPRRPSARR